ncbi:MAG: M64 family metallopeptidase, partial [Phycisphaerae bacterium]
MKPRLATVIAIPGVLAVVIPASGAFDDDFTGATLRVDYYHTGTATEEHLTLDRVRVEGPWPGSRTQLIDTTDLGKYLVEVVDRKTNRLLYSRGFCSIFGEWETTGEARQGTWRTIPEALRIPEPRQPFQLRIRKRDREQAFREIWSVCIDPDSKSVDRPPLPTRDAWVLMEHGAASSKVDLVVLGDGYSAEEMDKFRADAEGIVKALFDTEPFASRKQDFNVRAINAPAERSGITRPHAGVFRTTPLGTRYNIFDMRRYVLTFDDRAWRDVAAAVPYDFVLILINEQEFGGGGILNLYAITAAGSASAPFLLAHEFGHAFAGLADEYYVATAIDEDVVGR